MASSSKLEEEDQYDDNFEDELEGFDDFTLASAWERFISEMEAVCRLWLAENSRTLLGKCAICLESPKNLYKVKSLFKYSGRSYCLEYYFQTNTNGQISEWKDNLHDLQLSFGVTEFLVITPVSASGVILDAPESTKLISAVAIALSNCGSTWPAFVPVHDPSRKAYIGIQNMGTVLTRRFEADRIGSQVPVRLMHLEGLYELFASKFAFSMMDYSTSFLKINFTMKLTYKTPPSDDEDNLQGGDLENKDPEESPDKEILSRTQWDDDCPWTEWYSAEDPIKGFELIIIWSDKMVESSLQMAELENASSYDADDWIMSPILSPNMIDDTKHSVVGFASQLRLLVSAYSLSFEAQFIEDFTSVENKSSDGLKSLTTLPPPTVLDRVLKDLFHEGVEVLDYSKGQHPNSSRIKGAPLESLFAQFCLYSLWFGDCNIRAIAMLWIEFVREVRWCWEETQSLPRMLSTGFIDLSACLIHQKLQMLAICIKRKSGSNHITEDNVENNSDAAGCVKESGQVDGSTNHILSSEQFAVKHDSSQTTTIDYPISFTAVASADGKPLEVLRQGSVGTVGSMMLMNSYLRMHAPYTQDITLMTEDMHEERLHAVEALGSEFNFSAQLEKDILLSDMSAFKAANPGAIFEDFIRWHSPGDWEMDEFEENGSTINHQNYELDSSWPPRGRLSARMAEHGSSWREIWNDAPVLPTCKQKPLLDPNREGEKILHYLETIQPHQLLEQMVCTAFRASADSLNQTSFDGLKLMKTKLAQLYLTMASALKAFQANDLPEKNEIINDLERLTVVFEHVEKLLIFAASVHRNLKLTPRLSKAVFGDYYNYYIPRMGTRSCGSDNQKEEFDVKQQVRMHERQVVANLFRTPTANQSWRKVLSMGNLLNGHEPLVREIIFSRRDSLNDDHYESSISGSSKEEIETHRMYISGTSNDLSVALSVTSFD